MKRFQGKSRTAAPAVVALLALAAVFVSAYFTLRPQSESGGKTISIEIVKSQDDIKSLDISTDAEYLRQALEERQLIQGEDGLYGLFVTSVDGVTADDGKQEWWRFTKDGEMIMTSVDETPIYDGDRYEITLVAGY